MNKKILSIISCILSVLLLSQMAIIGFATGDEYANDCVIVVIKNKYTKVGQTFEPKDFDEELVKDVVDLMPMNENDQIDYSCIFVVIKPEYSKIDIQFSASDLGKDYIERIEDAMPLTKETLNLGCSNLLCVYLKKPYEENAEKLISLLNHNKIVDSWSNNVIHTIPCVGTCYTNNDILMSSSSLSSTSSLPSSLIIPSDPYSSQYAFGKISATRAWGISKGSSTIRVGVIDTGVSTTHPDLQSNLDVISSRNFTDDNMGLADQYNHGTHVSGIIGAVGNNSRGSTGICWHSKIVMLKACRTTQNGIKMSDKWFVDALRYAQQNGISIVNVSMTYGTSVMTKLTLQTAINNYSGLVVASAGNHSSTTIPYPAGLNCDNIISVAATDANDEICSFSNYNYTLVDIVAPGLGITNCNSSNLYETKSGTSMATPFVAGTAALIKAINPGMTTDQIKTCILNTTDNVPQLLGSIATSGRLNVFKAALSAGNYTLGDVDLSHTITASDARKILRFAARLDTFTQLQGVLADYNMDDVVSSADAQLVLQLAAHLA